MTTLWTSWFSSENLSRSFYVMLGFIVIWVLSMIALPIARWLFGDPAISWGVLAASVFQVSAVFVILAHAWGLRRAALTLALVAALTWLAETIGSATGIPFGHYHYTELLQPQVAGVPLLIPLAWFMMLPPAWAVAQVTVGRENRLAFVLVSALALTAWDLFLDPQKVAWGFWVWTDSTGTELYTGGYFGIPWMNYLGWMLVSVVVSWLARPAPVPARPLLVIYVIVWLFQTIGQLFFWDLPGPAVVGFVAMGALLVWVWRTSRVRWA
jgi:putative membrane protein